MAVFRNLVRILTVPSDVFGFEVNTDVGYGRDTFDIELPTGKTLEVGAVLSVDYATSKATLTTAPADATAVEALGDLAVFVGRDTTTNPATSNDFDNLIVEGEWEGKIVVIGRGDGRGTLKKKFLDFDGTKFYDLDAAVQPLLEAKFRQENRFKVQDQV